DRPPSSGRAGWEIAAPPRGSCPRALPPGARASVGRAAGRRAAARGSTSWATRPPVRLPAPARRARPRRRASLHDLGFERHLPVLRPQTEVDRFRTLVRGDARGLLRDQLLEAVELHGAGFSRQHARLDEAIVELAHGCGVAVRVAHPHLALAAGL